MDADRHNHFQRVGFDKAPPKRGCDAGAPDCVWAFYVGEGHPSHSVRLFSVFVDRASGSISVAGLDGRATPYERWRQTPTGVRMRTQK